VGLSFKGPARSNARVAYLQAGASDDPGLAQVQSHGGPSLMLLRNPCLDAFPSRQPDPAASSWPEDSGATVAIASK
jgi:hypothetical protein